MEEGEKILNSLDRLALDTNQTRAGSQHEGQRQPATDSGLKMTLAHLDGNPGYVDQTEEECGVPGLMDRSEGLGSFEQTDDLDEGDDLEQMNASLTQSQTNKQCPDMSVNPEMGKVCEQWELSDADHEMEIEFQYEADLPARYLTCKKNPGHVNFIPASKFSLAHLPSNYQDEMLVELVREQAKLAVRLKIKGSSPHRPKIMPGTTDVPYPFSSFRYKKMQRVGSGWVFHILKMREEDQTECPCSECQKSGDPKKVWTKVKVATAAHVVYDVFEAKKCVSHLFYDADDTDLNSCPALTEAIEVDSEPQADYCFINYAIHDPELSDFLDKTLEHYKTLCRSVRDVYKTKSADDKNLDLSVKMAKLFERCFHTNVLLGKQRDKIKAILEGDAQEQWQRYKAKRQNVQGDLDGIGACLVDKLMGSGQLAEKMLGNISDMYEQSCILVEHVGKLKDKCNTLKEGDSGWDKVLYGYTSFLDVVSVMEREVIQYKTNMSSGSDEDENEFPVIEPLYDPTHALTVIVSHPHGCSKRITVGEVTERANPLAGNASCYKYDNATCPGSSGARVYVLGRAGASFDHAHSGSILSFSDSNVQINESAIQQDL